MVVAMDVSGAHPIVAAAEAAKAVSLGNIEGVRSAVAGIVVAVRRVAADQQVSSNTEHGA